MSFLALVQINDLLRVNGQPLVGVDYHTKQARVCLKKRYKLKSIKSLNFRKFSSFKEETKNEKKFHCAVMNDG